MLTAQTIPVAGTSHIYFPWRSKRRRDHSAPKTKELPSGAMARERDVSYCWSLSGTLFSLGAVVFFQSPMERVVVSGGASFPPDKRGLRGAGF